MLNNLPIFHDKNPISILDCIEGEASSMSSSTSINEKAIIIGSLYEDKNEKAFFIIKETPFKIIILDSI